MVNWIERLPAYRGDGLLLVADGGATNCRVAVTDHSGELLGYGYGAGLPTNARAVGDDVAASNLVETVSMALGSGNIEPARIETCLITSASIDTMAHSAFMSASLAGIGLGDAATATVPDTMGCWASTAEMGPAVAIISGTGSVVIAADRERSIWRRFGGWDYILGDEGSGYALGRRALQETLLVDEGRSTATEIADAVLAQWGGGDAEALPDALHKPTVDKAWIASFARVLTDAAERGDVRALEILDEEIAFLADAAVAAVEVLSEAAGVDETVRIGLFGGIVKAPVFGEQFTSLVESRCAAPLQVSVPEHSALVGAAALGLIDLDVETRRVALDRLDIAVDAAKAHAQSKL